MPKSRLRVAIVDDEEPVRRALTRLCQAYELDVATFASARLLFDALGAGRQRPDCLVLDMHMSGLNGLEVLALLHRCGFDIPAIVMTGRDDAITRELAFATGAFAYLLKPIDADVLLDTIAVATGTPRTLTTAGA